MHAAHAAPPSPRAPAIALTLRFGDSVLSVAQLSPPRSFHVGEGGPGAPCDAFLPAAVLGAARAPLILVEAGVPLLLLPRGVTGKVRLGDQPEEDAATVAQGDGARPFADLEGAVLVPFPLGSQAELSIAGIQISASSGEAVDDVSGRAGLDRKNLLFVGASALAQIGLLGALSFFAPPARSIYDEPSAEQVYAIQAALLQQAGFSRLRHWTDESGWFAVFLGFA